MLRIAILDLYEGQANEGMRCIRQIIGDWSEFHGIEADWKEFDVRLAGRQLEEKTIESEIEN